MGRKKDVKKPARPMAPTYAVGIIMDVMVIVVADLGSRRGVPLIPLTLRSAMNSVIAQKQDATKNTKRPYLTCHDLGVAQ
jgi:hypothetical protein